MKIRNCTFIAAGVVLGLSMLSAKSEAQVIIFDDFNVDEGHFGYAPTFSSQSIGEAATSTADLVLGDNPLEGAGYQKLTLVPDGSSTPIRIRHISGGPPYNSANAATPVGNTGFSFQITSGVDGWIGFYVRTTATGWETSLNLDGAGGTGAEMDGGVAIPLIADGQWHLYEWNLDSTTSWGAVQSIGGGHGGGLLNGTHTIDSIYFREIDGSPGPTAEIHLDFVAKSASGSIAALVPEPSSALLAALGITGCAMRRRRH